MQAHMYAHTDTHTHTHAYTDTHAHTETKQSNLKKPRGCHIHGLKIVYMSMQTCE